MFFPWTTAPLGSLRLFLSLRPTANCFGGLLDSLSLPILKPLGSLSHFSALRPTANRFEGLPGSLFLPIPAPLGSLSHFLSLRPMAAFIYAKEAAEATSFDNNKAYFICAELAEESKFALTCPSKHRLTDLIHYLSLRYSCNARICCFIVSRPMRYALRSFWRSRSTGLTSMAFGGRITNSFPSRSCFMISSIVAL